MTRKNLGKRDRNMELEFIQRLSAELQNAVAVAEEQLENKKNVSSLQTKAYIEGMVYGKKHVIELVTTMLQAEVARIEATL